MRKGGNEGDQFGVCGGFQIGLPPRCKLCGHLSLDGPEEALGVPPGLERSEEDLGGLLHMAGEGTDTVETDELGFDNGTKGMFGMITTVK